MKLHASAQVRALALVNTRKCMILIAYWLERSEDDRRCLAHACYNIGRGAAHRPIGSITIVVKMFARGSTASALGRRGARTALSSQKS